MPFPHFIRHKLSRIKEKWNTLFIILYNFPAIGISWNILVILLIMSNIGDRKHSFLVYIDKL